MPESCQTSTEERSSDFAHRGRLTEMLITEHACPTCDPQTACNSEQQGISLAPCCYAVIVLALLHWVAWDSSGSIAITQQTSKTIAKQGTLEYYLVQLLLCNEEIYTYKIRLFRHLSSLTLNASKDEAASIYLGNLFQGLTTLIVKNFFL